MKRNICLSLTAMLLAACDTSLTPPRQPAASGEVIIHFKAGTAETDKGALRQRFEATDIRQLMPDAEQWTIAKSGPLTEILDSLDAQPEVKFAQANGRYQLAPMTAGTGTVPKLQWTIQAEGGPNDPALSRQWYLEQAGFSDPGSHQGQGVVVAVIDSGVDPEHPDLKANLLPLIDEVAAMGKADTLGIRSYDHRDGHGHGTHVCGIIGAVANNGLGVAGAAAGVKILPIKVTNARGVSEDGPIAKGIFDAVQQGAKVINLSIGGTDESPILLEAINYAFQRNVAVVIASGNDGGALNYPAAYNGAISVGAVTHQRRIANYSSHGDGLVMVAPGGMRGDLGILATTPTYPCQITLFEGKKNDYDEMVGTSMAAPLVTAAVALLLAQEPGLSPAQVRTRLAATTDDLGSKGYDAQYGYGVLNTRRMLAANSDDGRPTAPHR